MDLDRVKGFFRSFKWYEYALFILLYIMIIVLSVYFKAHFLIPINSILGITGSYLTTKGKWLGQAIGAVQCLTYSTLAFFNQYYGEVIVCICVAIPINIIGAITWLKNKDKKNRVVKINSNLPIKEWTIVSIIFYSVIVVFYFLLRAFNTANLIISTLSLAITSLALYLVARRCIYNFYVYMVNNVLLFVLWISIVTTQGDMAYILTAINYVIYFAQNVFGVINWWNIKKKQNADVCDKIIKIIKEA